MEEAPRPVKQHLTLTSDHIEMIDRLASFEVEKIFAGANRSNNESPVHSIFLFVSDIRTERSSSPQRVFRLRGILHKEFDLTNLLTSIWRDEPASAVRVITLSEKRLWSAVQYDPVDGRANADIAISS